MPSRKKLLSKARLYLILDTEVAGYEKLFDTAALAVRGGVDIVQLRDKAGSARAIEEFSRRVRKMLRGRALCIINDRVDVALALQADGVHLGQEDLPINFSRRMMGKDFLIGKSCQSAEHVRAAVKGGADYIGFGSIFKTLTKPERDPMNLQLLRRVVQAARIPLFPIGGITPANLPELVKHGVRRVAVCRSILLARDPLQASQVLKTMLAKATWISRG